MSSSLPLFKDVAKNANDLLNKGFVSSDKYLWKVEFDTVSDNGIQFTPNISETPAGHVEGEFKSKFKTVRATFTTTANLKQDISLETASNTYIKDIFKPTVTVSTTLDNPLERAKIKLADEILIPNARLNGVVELPISRFLEEGSKEQAKTTLSAVVGLADTGFGVAIEGELSESVQLNCLNGYLTYAKSNLEASLYFKKKASIILGSNFYLKNPTLRYQNSAIGGEITHDLSSDKAPVLTLAATWKPDETSTIKSRLNSRGVLGVSWTQAFSGPLSISFLVDINLSIVAIHESQSVQWGVKLAVK